MGTLIHKRNKRPRGYANVSQLCTKKKNTTNDSFPWLVASRPLHDSYSYGYRATSELLLLVPSLALTHEQALERVTSDTTPTPVRTLVAYHSTLPKTNGAFGGGWSRPHLAPVPQHSIAWYGFTLPQV